MLTKTVMAACISAAFSWTAAPSIAATVWVQQAPPEARVEAPPPTRHGYQWVPGYWDWRHHHHVWVAGTWVRERPGYVYAAPTWVEHNGRWQLQRGQWNRHDRDHDGIRDSHDHDRDGDGVPNRRDRRPDDPNRQ